MIDRKAATDAPADLPAQAGPNPDAADDQQLSPLVRALSLAVERKASLDRGDKSGWQ